MSDTELLDWLERNTYAYIRNERTGKGSILFSRDHNGSPYGLRKAIAESIDKERGHSLHNTSEGSE